MVGTAHFFNATCTAIGPDCPVEDSAYGYHPHLGINISILTAFACLTLVHVGLGIWKRAFFFASLLVFTCVGETAGYAGRILLHGNPYDYVGLYLDLCCLTFAPSFLAAAVHATLKHTTLTFGATTSILPPPMYTWMFIGRDMVCLVFLAIGATLSGIGERRDHPVHTGRAGDVFILAGIVGQILTLVIFAGLVLDYLYRTRRAWHNVPFAAAKLVGTLKFKLFVAGVSIAYVGVLVRCLYRLLAFAGDWPNSVMGSEAGFIVCESCMILAATLAFTLFHPGFCFALSKHTRWRWRLTFTEPTAVKESMEMACEGKPSEAATAAAAVAAADKPHQGQREMMAQRPRPVYTTYPARRHTSSVTRLAARLGEASFGTLPIDNCWYSIDLDDDCQNGSNLPSASSHLRHGSRESSSRDTWNSGVTLQDTDVVEVAKPTHARWSR